MPTLDSVDISESALFDFDPQVLETLLFDHSSRRNILWCTDDYAALGPGFTASDEITVPRITGDYGALIRPRALKSRELQRDRTRDKAEVFTPSWICNAQNNLVDGAWFGRDGVFNSENPDNTWVANPRPVSFPPGTTWKDYVRDTRLEITCGEAPYLASRYDTTTGAFIPVPQRIGLLDRKLRVVGENVHDHDEWLRWAQIAYQHVYAYEWQGDSLLIARETLLQTFFDYHAAKFGPGFPLQLKSVRYIAYIISWNLWQMDGLKGVVPGSCVNRTVEEVDLFGDVSVRVESCLGCRSGDLRSHNGVYALVRDWGARKEKQKIRFIDLVK